MKASKTKNRFSTTENRIAIKTGTNIPNLNSMQMIQFTTNIFITTEQQSSVLFFKTFDIFTSFF